MNEAAPIAVSGAKAAGRFDLTFARVGDRTKIIRQYVSYPFHLTRPFTLDPDIPALTTIYQQSASGGLYRADGLTSRIELIGASAVHLTTQAATVVHDCHGDPARQSTAIAMGEGGFLALTPDPAVLFPGAAVEANTIVKFAQGAAVFLADAFACHDPTAAGRPFDHYICDTRILAAADGRALVRDRIAISGKDLQGRGSPMADWRIAANYFLLGPLERLPLRDRLVEAAGGPDAIGGVTALPNGAGWGVRVLSRTAVANRRVADTLFVLAVAAALGADPVARRK
jgi:urease accessory protein